MMSALNPENAAPGLSVDDALGLRLGDCLFGAALCLLDTVTTGTTKSEKDSLWSNAVSRT